MERGRHDRGLRDADRVPGDALPVLESGQALTARRLEVRMTPEIRSAEGSRGTRGAGPTVQQGIPLLRAVGVRKSFYKGGVEIPVVRGVDLTIHLGEMV